MLGVMGGMGPIATADFLQKLVRATSAEFDQEHPEVIVFSNPKIPDRVGPILGKSSVSPLPALIDTAKRLEDFGAQVLVMPCNTAHYWHAEVERSVSVPFLHIADVTCEEIKSTLSLADAKVGILATQGTLHARIYQDRLRACGVSYLLPSQEELEQHVLPAIAAVKRDSMSTASRFLTTAIDRMAQRGAEKVLLACTELPIVLEHVKPGLQGRCVDPTEILARASISALGGITSGESD